MLFEQITEPDRVKISRKYRYVVLANSDPHDSGQPVRIDGVTLQVLTPNTAQRQLWRGCKYLELNTADPDWAIICAQRRLYLCLAPLACIACGKSQVLPNDGRAIVRIHQNTTDDDFRLA